MKKILICALFFIVSRPLFATSIVVLITADYIVIGADSRRMIIDAERNSITYQTVCKIRNVDSYYYAAAGFIASATTSFSADSIINRHLKQQKKIDKALRLIRKDLKKALQKELVNQKTDQPKQYKRTLEMKSHILEVVVLSMNNGVPQAHIIGFELENEETMTIKDYVAKRSAEHAQKENQFFFLGEYSGMEKYLNTKNETADPVLLVNQLIITQSLITPSSVGAPVSLIKFGASKVEWIRNSCEN